MKPISIDIRRLIIRAKSLNMSIKETAYLYCVSISSVKQIYRLYKQTGSLKPKGFPGRTSRLTEEMVIAINQKMKDQPDATLEKIIEELNLPIRKSQLNVFLIKRGYSRKKKHYIQKHNKEKM